MFAFAQKCEYFAENGNLVCPGNDGFYAFARLGRIRRVGDDNPITMAIERETIYEDLFPGLTHLRVNSSSEQTATLPHFPEAIRA